MDLKDKNPGKLFVLSGPSGAGKGTICRRLLEETDKLELSVSMTTRAPRCGEAEGVSYFFTDKDTFEEHISCGNLLEHAEVYGNYYGTPKAPVLQRLSEGIDVILEIDMQGALKKTIRTESLSSYCRHLWQNSESVLREEEQRLQKP